MKKKIFIIFIILNLLLLTSCTSSEKTTIDSTSNNDSGIHLLLNSDGSYGGTYDLENYGEGAPLNGEYDIDDSIYYNNLDYYNMGSTETRTMLYHFMPYQKTMKNTDGISCLYSLMSYYGMDMESYSELSLVNSYESINQVSLKDEKETLEELSELVESIGLTCEYGEANVTSDKECYSFFYNYLKNGKAVIVPFNDGTPGFVMVVGCDDMGTNGRYGYYDDLLIMVDPNDALDHHQDGFTIESSTAFYTWWTIMNINGSNEMTREYLVVNPIESFNVNEAIKVRDDITYSSLIYPENNLLIQPDGAYLSNYYTLKFNSLTHNKNGVTDGASNLYFDNWSDQEYHHNDSYYYARCDFYNMLSNYSNGEYIVSNFRSHVQNMGSTCGICAFTNILNYYGIDTMSTESNFDEAIVASDYEQLNSSYYIQGNGTTVKRFRELFNTTKYKNQISLIDSWYSAGVGKDSISTKKPDLKFNTYSEFASYCKDCIKNGNPIAVSWKPCHGHWTVIIGYMDFNNDNPYDDVIIMGDSSDYRDHYFDGYDIHPAMTFFNRWTNTSQNILQAYYVINVK